MPNHVRNKLTVLGPADDVKRFVAAARGRSPRTGDRPGSPNYHEEAKPESLLCFHAIVPLPDAYSDVPYSDMAKDAMDGYKMEVTTWGVKWGAYEILGPAVRENRATWFFETAWESPITWVLKASVKWPALTFVVSYGGEGPVRGRYAVATGSIIHELHDDFDALDYPNDEDSELDNEDKLGWYDIAEHLYIMAHWQYVKTFAFASSMNPLVTE